MYQKGMSLLVCNSSVNFSWVSIKKNKFSLILNFFLTLAALSFLLFDKIISNEAEQYSKIVTYEFGY